MEYCCDVLCPNEAKFKIVYNPELDLGEMGYTFSCPEHLETLKLSLKDTSENV